MKIQDFTGAALRLLGKLYEASSELKNKARQELEARAKAKAEAKQKAEQEQARIRAEQQERARAKMEAEAKRKAEQQEQFNSLFVKSRGAIEKSLRELPDGTRIFLDTCLIMEAEAVFGLDIWFDYLRENAAPRNWQVILLKAVAQELDYNKDNSEHPEKACKVRSGVKWLKMLQENVGERLHVLGAPKKDWERADDIFHKYMQPGDVLFTLDLLLYINTKAEHKLEARLPIDLTAEEAEAMCRLAMCYRSGTGVERNEHLAQVWLTQAATKDAGAMNLLGEQSAVSLAYGIPYKSFDKDTDRDECKIKEAENNKWFKAAANAGNPIAMIHRGEFERAKSFYRIDERPGWFFQKENGRMDLSTSLSWAVQLGKYEDVAELIRRGANVNAKSPVRRYAVNYGNCLEEVTPLFVAAQNGLLDVAKLLLEKGAKVNEKCIIYRSSGAGYALKPLDIVLDVEMAELLLKHGAQVECSSWENIINRNLIEAVGLFVEYSKNARTLSEPLRMSVAANRLEIAKILIEKGADAKAKDRDGKTPIDLMTSKGWNKDFIESLKHPMLHRLKDKVFGGHETEH